MKWPSVLLATALVLIGTVAYAATPEFLQIEDFGGAGDGKTDNTDALNRAVKECEKKDIRHIHFGIGRYIFKSPPSPFKSGIFIEGMNRSETQLVADYDRVNSLGNFLEWTGGFTSPNLRGFAYAGNGGGLRNLDIVAANLTKGGVAVWIVPYKDAQDTSGTAAPSGILEIANIEVYAEGKGSWNWGLYVDGSHTTRGLYDLFVRGSVFMGATEQEVRINKGVFIHFDQIGLFGGTVLPKVYGLLVDGASQQIRINGFSNFPYFVSPDSTQIWINGKLCSGSCLDQTE